MFFKNTKKTKDFLLLKDLLYYSLPYKKNMIIIGLFILLTMAMQLSRPLVTKLTIDKGFVASNDKLILYFSILYFFTVIVGIVARFFQSYLLNQFGQKIIYQIREDVFKKIIYRSKQEFEDSKLGTLVTNVTNDAESIRSLFTDVLLNLITSFIMLVGILIFLLYLNIYIGLISLCIVPILLGLIGIYKRYGRQAFRKVRTKVSASNSVVQETLNYIVIIKTYVSEQVALNRYDEVSKEYLNAGLQEVKTLAIFRPIIDSLYFIIVVAIFTFTDMSHSLIDAGTLFACLQYIQRLFIPINDIAEKYTILQQSLAGAERILPIINKKNFSEPKKLPIKSLGNIHTIRFEHVWFAYEGDHYVLEDINITIHAGDFVGIVGPSGSGKTTLINLLMGFLKPTKGAIYINDINISTIKDSVLREYIAYVFQDSHLFKGTIEENITLYDDTISKENIISTTKKAHLYDMILKLPQGFNTNIGYLGSLLSGGQRQLLSLARALLREKPILLFDEATANIDSETERLIQESIQMIKGCKTIISIAHRLSTIKDADTIFYIEQGIIREAGSFNALIEKKGYFNKLWSATHGVY